MAFNYSKLKGRIVEKFGNQSEFSKAMKWSERTLSLKISGRVSWKQSDIMKAIDVLELTVNDVQDYFFNIEVQNI